MAYVVRTEDLRNMVQALTDKRMEYTVLSYSEPDDDPEDPLPAAICFGGMLYADSGKCYEFGEIEIVAEALDA